MKRTEDILIAEDITPEKIQDELEASIEDIHAAKQLYFYLRTPKNLLPSSEKQKLKIKIEVSVNDDSKRKRRRLWLSVASVFVFAVFAGVWYFQMNTTPAIVSFANRLSDIENDSTTRLVLNTGQEIHIETVDSEIEYDQKGERINIGSDRKILQKLEPLKLIYNTVIVPYGKRAQITLSEGTKVWLNSGSKLIYPAIFAPDTREVYIDGEGIFEVAKNIEKPFIVRSSRFDVEVVGTVFNVSAYSDDKYSYAVLEEGTIKLNHKTKAYKTTGSCLLLPGDMAVLDPDREHFDLKKVDPSDYLSWRDGYYVFKSERLDNILKKLSRYYNIEIVLDNKDLAYDTFSGSLHLKSNPEKVLDIVKKTTQFQYRREEDERIIVY